MKKKKEKRKKKKEKRKKKKEKRKKELKAKGKRLRTFPFQVLNNFIFRREIHAVKTKYLQKKKNEVY